MKRTDRMSLLAVSRHDDLLLRVVDHPDGPMLDLGRCWDYSDNKQDEEHVHLALKSGENSIVFSNRNHSAVFDNWTVFVTWNEMEWYQILSAETPR